MTHTSDAAAASIAPTARHLQTRVLTFLKDRWEQGATDEECQDAMAMNPSTQRPRRLELVAYGKAKDSGRTRMTRAGRKAIVWVAV